MKRTLVYGGVEYELAADQHLRDELDAIADTAAHHATSLHTHTLPLADGRTITIMVGPGIPLAIVESPAAKDQLPVAGCLLN